jgi:hypothetical protein
MIGEDLLVPEKPWDAGGHIQMEGELLRGQKIEVQLLQSPDALHKDLETKTTMHH